MTEQEHEQQREALTRMLEELWAERVQAQRAWSQARWHDPDPDAEAAAQAHLDEMHRKISEATEFARQIDLEFRPPQRWWQAMTRRDLPKEKVSMLNRLRRWWRFPDVDPADLQHPTLTRSEARRVLATVAECLDRGQYPPTPAGVADCLRAKFPGMFVDVDRTAFHVDAALANIFRETDR